MTTFYCANCGKYADMPAGGYLRQADNSLLCGDCAYYDPQLAWEFGYRYGSGQSRSIRHWFPTVTSHFDAGVQAGQNERQDQEAAEHASWLADQARYNERERLLRERDELIRGVRDTSDG